MPSLWAFTDFRGCSGCNLSNCPPLAESHQIAESIEHDRRWKSIGFVDPDNCPIYHVNLGDSGQLCFSTVEPVVRCPSLTDLLTKRPGLMIGYLIFGLLFVLLIVFTVMTVRNWHWSHIVVLILTFITGIAASIGAAKTLKMRRQGLVDVKNSEERLEAVTVALKKQRFGEPTAHSYSTESLRGVEEALKLRRTGRGRVWESGAVSVNDNNRIFTFPQPRNPGDPQIGILSNVLVFAFLDEQFVSPDDPSASLSYPAKFVGTFRVTNEKAESLELVPELVLNDEMYQAPGSWTLFEKMPSDQHDVFDRQKADGSGEMSLSEFRQKLQDVYLPAANVGLLPDSAEYEAFIDRQAFDGRSLGEIDRWIEENSATRINQRFTPDPEEVFVRYRFNKKSAHNYKVDGQGNLITDGGYTLLGEAIDPALHLGADVSFNQDEEVTIDLPTATGYQRSDQTIIEPFNQREDVTEVNRIFRRRLYNFPSVFADLRRQAVDLGKRAAEVRAQNEVQAVALANVQSQIAKRDDILTKIREDNANLQKDVEAIVVLLKLRTNDLELMKQEIADLERKLNAKRSGRDGRPE